jgi:signal transduction histidine kinase
MTPDTTPSPTSSASAAAAPGSGQPPRAPKAGTGTALALLIAVVVTGPACLLSVSAAPESFRTAVAWGSASAAVLLSIAAAMTVHGILTARGLRAVIAQQKADADTERAVAAHFADVVVPILVERLRSGASAQTALAAVPTVANHTHQRVLHSLANEVHRGEGMRAAAMAACANAAGRVQALATSMAADLREMQHKYADGDVLGDLLHLDHRTAQTGRLADSIAVLTGARTGRRWAKPIVMESILRGAMGRISGYQRVRLHSSCELAVAGHAAEGVMHALAEIMDNAANFSPPTSEVHVYVEEASAGVIITVEDGGLVMGEVALERAQQAVSSESLDLTNLSGTRLGLAVVGRLAHKHNLSVSFRPSAHGGTGVLLMIPQTLITQSKKESESGSAPATSPSPSATSDRTRPAAAASTAPVAPEAPEKPAIPQPRTSGAGGPQRSDPAPSDTTQGGLPKRRRPEGAAGGPGGSARAGSRSTPSEPSPEHAPAADSSETASEPRPQTGSGLPKRRRGQTLAAAQRRSAAAAGKERAAEPPRAPSDSGTRFGAFRRAVQGGSAASSAASPASPASPASDPSPEQEPDGPEAAGSSPTTPSPSSSRPEDTTE